MTIWTNQSGNYRQDDEELLDFNRFERISHRREGECPVRSHASRSKARMRSRGGPSARRKAREFNGANRRGRPRYMSLAM